SEERAERGAMSEFFDRERLTEVEVPAVPLPERHRAEPPEPPEEAPAVEAAEVAEAAEAEAAEAVEQHAGGDFHVPEGYSVLEGAIRAERRSVAVVVSRFNAEITGRML